MKNKDHFAGLYQLMDRKTISEFRYAMNEYHKEISFNTKLLTLSSFFMGLGMGGLAIILLIMSMLI